PWCRWDARTKPTKACHGTLGYLAERNSRGDLSTSPCPSSQNPETERRKEEIRYSHRDRPVHPTSHCTDSHTRVRPNVLATRSEERRVGKECREKRATHAENGKDKVHAEI